MAAPLSTSCLQRWTLLQEAAQCSGVLEGTGATLVPCGVAGTRPPQGWLLRAQQAAALLSFQWPDFYHTLLWKRAGGEWTENGLEDGRPSHGRRVLCNSCADNCCARVTLKKHELFERTTDSCLRLRRPRACTAARANHSHSQSRGFHRTAERTQAGGPRSSGTTCRILVPPTPTTRRTRGLTSRRCRRRSR